jgi:hypothetical protein
MKLDEYIEKLIKIRYPDSCEWGDIREWCSVNCTGKFYSSIDWAHWENTSKNRCIEFEREQDAIMFTLRWL